VEGVFGVDFPCWVAGNADFGTQRTAESLSAAGLEGRAVKSGRKGGGKLRCLLWAKYCKTAGRSD